MKKSLYTFPDLGKAAKVLKIAVELEGVKPDSIFGVAIYNGLREHRTKDVVNMILDQAKDNRKMVAEIVGENLLCEIESLEGRKITVDSEGQLGCGC